MLTSSERHAITVNLPFQLRAHHLVKHPLLQDGRAVRDLKVLVDVPVWDMLRESEGHAFLLLRALLQGERISMSLYGDDGPPPDVERCPDDSPFGGGEAIGWTVVTMNDDLMVPYKITTATEESVSGEALFADQVFAARMVLEQEQAMGDERDALLITVAQEVGADLLITERASLLNARLLQRGNCQVAAPVDALALVALYLRAAGQFIAARGDWWSFVAPPTQFYQQMAEAHLPTLAEFVRRADGVVSPATTSSTSEP